MAKHFPVWFLALGLCFAATGWSAERKGVKMPDQVTDQGHQLVLNGLGCVRHMVLFRSTSAAYILRRWVTMRMQS